MPRFLNPPHVPRPASRYSQAVAVGPAAKRLIVSGQIGMNAAGELADGLEAQLAQAFDNFLALVESAQMNAADIVKITVYVTLPGSVEIYRRVRDEKLGKHLPTATYLEVAGLAHSGFLAEVEGEAIRES